MPIIPDLHTFTAVLKGGFEITTVWAATEFDARIMAENEMKVDPLKRYFTQWAKDGYKMKDNGAVE